ncbi:hypothetical protein BFW88_14175 [Pseudomonas fluorescens]|nr:hypothetical protein BFW88_14175 [Pseudomonas fluorescens]OPB09373.1 hypothetical protein BFW92_14365 [Pseudomonas fluorescens]OPB21218.1 hypothetical protein BFW93_14150 [Pseudomonas fluorescens]
MNSHEMTLNPPWLANFYDPALFDAGAGDADSASTIAYYCRQLKGPACSVLDLGCGTGRLAFALLDDGHRVHGVDISAPMLGYLATKAEALKVDARERLSWTCGSVLDLPVGETFDVLVAADDFVTHFDLDELGRFLVMAGDALRPGGRLLTDMRERSPVRLAAAAGALPKPMQSYGLTGGILTATGPRYAAMMGWEEYDPHSRWLVSHQLYSFIDAQGREERRDWKTIRQRNHSNAEFIEAALQAGFAVEQAVGRGGDGQLGEQGGFFQLVRL